MRRPTRPCPPPLWACVIFLGACGPSTPQPAVPGGDEAEAPASPETATLTPAEGAAAIEQPCTEGVEERCDAVDQDCDGAIDEGCGYATGALQVTLTWNSDADLDLVVSPPEGPSLDSSNPSLPSGATLDHQGRGACAQEDPPHGNLENAHWPEAPSAGDYRIAVSYVSGCADEPPPTTATVSVSYGGEVRGVYNVTLAEPASAPVATLGVP